jgi:hypothetical protein
MNVRATPWLRGGDHAAVAMAMRVVISAPDVAMTALMRRRLRGADHAVVAMTTPRAAITTRGALWAR